MRYSYLSSIVVSFLFVACNQNRKAAVPHATQENTFATDSILQVHKNFPFLAKYNFEAYKCKMYIGKLADPNFSNNPFAGDPEYVNFIIGGRRKGINFGGKYTLIEKSCGAMCSHLFMVDRVSGKIFVSTNGLKQQDGYYGFEYKKDSYLLITDSSILTDRLGKSNEFGITPQIFEWKKNSFLLLE